MRHRLRARQRSGSDPGAPADAGADRVDGGAAAADTTAASDGHPPSLLLPEHVTVDDVERLLRRYDPNLVRRRGRMRAAGGSVSVRVRRGTLWIDGDDRVARGIRHHLGGEWKVAPPPPGPHDEPVEDMLRVYVARALLPAEIATLLKAVRPGVVIRQDRKLDLFWFDDPDSVLNVSAWTIDGGAAGPVVLGRMRTPGALFEVGVDDVDGPTPESAAEAWRVAAELVTAFGGVPVDRYGFRVTGPGDLLSTPRTSKDPASASS